MTLQAMSERSVSSNVTALLAWIDQLAIRLASTPTPADLMDTALTEIGLSNGKS